MCLRSRDSDGACPPRENTLTILFDNLHFLSALESDCCIRPETDEDRQRGCGEGLCQVG